MSLFNVTSWGCLFLFLAPAMAPGQGPAADDLTTYGVKAWEESKTPIRPGKPGEAPFWNGHARQFIYAPAFDYKTVNGAVKYRFDVTSEKTSATVSFEGDVPYAPLSPVWAQVPVGHFRIVATGLKDDGTTAGEAGSGRHYRASPFNGPYHEPPPMRYDESASLAMKTLLHKPFVNYWLEHKKPDPDFQLYQYAAKLQCALVIGAITQARLTSGTEEGKRSEQIARIVTDYLMDLRFPDSSKWAGHIPTYHGPHVKKNQHPHMVLENHLAVMGKDAGMMFLDMYDFTGEERFKEAAIKVAETYKRTQLDHGSWPMFVRHETGEAAVENIAIPTPIINFLSRLSRNYGVKDFDETAERAYQWMLANPVKTWDWQGQYEDIPPRPPYVNHGRLDACEFAIYLFKNKKDLKLAEDLVRFAEDQFTIWEQALPYDVNPKQSSPALKSKNWLTPVVQEQYVYFMPVGRAAATMLDAFWYAYESTGNDLYLAKAKSLANSTILTQMHHDGDYPTFFVEAKQRQYWLNSSVYSAEIMRDLEKHLETIGDADALKN